MNAFVERFVQSIKQECLDHFIVFGTQHMDYLCREYVEYYHTEQPHQRRENELLTRAAVNAETESLPLEARDSVSVAAWWTIEIVLA